MRRLRCSDVTLGLIAACGLLFAAPAAALADVPADPLKSGRWKDLVARLLDNGPVVLDERVKVIVPSIVENQAQVPVAVDARSLPGVTRLVVFADYNPIEHVLTLLPGKAQAYISFRMKAEQGTPVRAAALTSDGVWHVGSVYLDAAGGGCSQPALARRDADWSTTVGMAQARTWREADGQTRLRMRLRHPMDTGLAKDNTPAFHIERFDARGSGGEMLATVLMQEPVSEDPTVTLLLRPAAGDATIETEARDNNGGVYRSTIPAALTE